MNVFICGVDPPNYFALTFLILQTQDKTISICLGENGEYKKLIDYYTLIPERRIDGLLVSTEPTLFIYEGNYLNRKYDTIIGEFDIPNTLEGHEIFVDVEIGTDHRISVTVEDDSHNVIIPSTLL